MVDYQELVAWRLGCFGEGEEVPSPSEGDSGFGDLVAVFPDACGGWAFAPANSYITSFTQPRHPSQESSCVGLAIFTSMTGFFRVD